MANRWCSALGTPHGTQVTSIAFALGQVEIGGVPLSLMLENRHLRTRLSSKSGLTSTEKILTSCESEFEVFRHERRSSSS